MAPYIYSEVKYVCRPVIFGKDSSLMRRAFSVDEELTSG